MSWLLLCKWLLVLFTRRSIILWSDTLRRDLWFISWGSFRSKKKQSVVSFMVFLWSQLLKWLTQKVWNLSLMRFRSVVTSSATGCLNRIHEIKSRVLVVSTRRWLDLNSRKLIGLVHQWLTKFFFDFLFKQN